jgi:hypothetical protein
MTKLTKEQIKEIAEQLDCGLRCFWNKKNGELLFIPNKVNYPDIETEAWSDEIEKLENNFDDYKEIDQLESKDSFEIMVDFVASLNNSTQLKSKLINALNMKKPFREFKFVIDNSSKYKQQWFDFKNQKLQKWVQDKFDHIIQK